MTSEVEERPSLITASYGWHGSQWVKKNTAQTVAITIVQRNVKLIYGPKSLHRTLKKKTKAGRNRKRVLFIKPLAITFISQILQNENSIERCLILSIWIAHCHQCHRPAFMSPIAIVLSLKVLSCI